ncbi:MAG: hypothetical protein JSU94_20510 [Phycisphaerales bacterium]|nr:MAG: hypothetical protein JSU94_20510 [Phycisphaerales bacterium]
MRKLVAVSGVLLICVVLSSCTSVRPEDAFLGSWKGTHEGEGVEVVFMEEDMIVVTAGEEQMAGTWTVGEDGSARITIDDGEVTATATSDGMMVIRGKADTVVLKRAEKRR